MEKIKLNNGQEFDLIPMGISQTDKKRLFKFTSQLTYNEILSLFSDTAHLSSISHVLEDGTTNQTYLDCVTLKGLNFAFGVQVDENTTADVYTVEISIDAVERTIQTLLSEVELLKAENQTLQDTIDVLVLSSLEV